MRIETFCWISLCCLLIGNGVFLYLRDPPCPVAFFNTGGLIVILLIAFVSKFKHDTQDTFITDVSDSNEPMELGTEAVDPDNSGEQDSNSNGDDESDDNLGSDY